jgi:hypothetical protein
VLGRTVVPRPEGVALFGSIWHFLSKSVTRNFHGGKDFQFRRAKKKAHGSPDAALTLLIRKFAVPSVVNRYD